MTTTQPRYRNKKTRVNVALIKHYKDGWTLEEIADYLHVRSETVQGYLDSPAGEEVERILSEQAASIRVDLARYYLERLDKLKEIEDDLLQRRKMIVSAHELRTVDGVVKVPKDLMVDLDEHMELGPREDLPKPVATAYREVVDIQKDLSRVWEEIDRYTEKVEDLLGLEAPKRAEIDSTHEERSVQVKVWRMEDGDYPEQPVFDEEEHADMPKAPGGAPIELIEDSEEERP